MACGQNRAKFGLVEKATGEAIDEPVEDEPNLTKQALVRQLHNFDDLR
jgi:hypothetical protein